MLIMKCSKCDKYISSALLAEITTVVCEHCGTEVAVNNVLVSSNGFTFDREDLLKRFFRYRKLLDEVIDERNSMVDNSDVSDVSKRSIEQFLTILQGMMSGAREKYRLEFQEPLVAKLCYSRHECSGIFYNLSTEGACVEISQSNPLPRVRGGISLEFSLPDQPEIFAIDGYICWTQRAKSGATDKHSFGVQFRGVDSSVHAKLWRFISAGA
ncbi:MAG: PilZ domain-containing protein, partial [Desulfuromonadales bacterium]|nr:PilZ domain-containing protein [Desulfuromonadales bacterium]